METEQKLTAREAAMCVKINEGELMGPIMTSEEVDAAIRRASQNNHLPSDEAMREWVKSL